MQETLPLRCIRRSRTSNTEGVDNGSYTQATERGICYLCNLLQQWVGVTRASDFACSLCGHRLIIATPLL